MAAGAGEISSRSEKTCDIEGNIPEKLLRCCKVATRIVVCVSCKRFFHLSCAKRISSIRFLEPGIIACCGGADDGELRAGSDSAATGTGGDNPVNSDAIGRQDACDECDSLPHPNGEAKPISVESTPAGLELRFLRDLRVHMESRLREQEILIRLLCEKANVRAEDPSSGAKQVFNVLEKSPMKTAVDSGLGTGGDFVSDFISSAGKYCERVCAVSAGLHAKTTETEIVDDSEAEVRSRQNLGRSDDVLDSSEVLPDRRKDVNVTVLTERLPKRSAGRGPGGVGDQGQSRDCGVDVFDQNAAKLGSACGVRGTQHSIAWNVAARTEKPGKTAVGAKLPANSATSNNLSRRRNHKQRSSPIFGKAKGDAPFNAVPRKAALFISRIQPGTTAENMAQSLRGTFPEVKCEPIRTKFPDEYSSFKMIINEDNVGKAFDPNLWPAGTLVNKFFSRKSSYKDT